MPLRFVNPNYHVILIHYPLGVFALGVFLELFSLLWRKSSVRAAAAWMILLGAFLSLPAVTSGISALYDVSKFQHITGERYELLKMHVWYQSCASLLAVTCAVIGLGLSDSGRKKLHLPLLLGFLIALGGMVAGSWNGGETIYRNGTSVLIIDKKGEITELEKPDLTDKYNKFVNYYAGGEQQLHIIGAGFAFAALFAGLGLSIRRLTTLRAAAAENAAERQITRPPTGAPPRRTTDDLSVIRSLNPESGLDYEPPHVPVGRWWLVATLVTVLTAVGGYWIMSQQDFANPTGWNDDFVSRLGLSKVGVLLQPKTWDINRHLAHVALGGAMVLLALFLGLISKVAPRRPWLLTLFGFLLVLTVGAQVWMGIALTFDGGKGPLFRFKPVATETTSESSNSSTPTSATPAPEATPAPAAPTPATAPAATADTAPATQPTTAPTIVPLTAPTPAPEQITTPAPVPAPAPAETKPPETPAPAPAAPPQ
jgi:uncharacterized membrane protein